MENQIRCPKCNSNQLSAHKKGFSGQKAVAGAVLTGGIGLLAGTIGSNKILITCLNCGHQFKPGDKPIIKSKQSTDLAGTVVIAIVVLILLAGIIYFISDDKTTNSTLTQENNATVTDTTAKNVPSTFKIIHSSNLIYTVINKDHGTDNLIKDMYVYIPNLHNIEKINDELVASYKSPDATDFQIFYFNNKKIAANYGNLLFDSNISDEESNRASKHVIAKYEYSSITTTDHLYTGAHSDDN